MLNFVSYYDYYQPEAYIATTDTYIEKDSSINDEIDELRHAATSALINYKDVIVVASVSCIYGIGEKSEYEKNMLILTIGDKISRNKILNRLIDMTYERNDLDFHRGTFRVRGNNIDIIPVNEKVSGIRIILEDDIVSEICVFDPLTGVVTQNKKSVTISPASHFVTSKEKLEEACNRIEKELKERLQELKDENKLIEEQRLRERTNYDLEMLRETGFCNGVENYSRHLALRDAGETPSCLIDFFPKDFLLVVDESHVMLPQIRGMYNGDRARKESLVGYGFRLKASFDNRPLNFDEFASRLGQTIYVSATPGDYEKNISDNTVEQLIRPTGLLDPEIEVLPTNDQIAVLMDRIKEVVKHNERVLVTTLTKKMAESLTTYLCEHGIKAKYMHSEIDTIERIEIINALRSGEFDVLVGINLLREGLDLPEVSMVAILDADKEGFLRSEGALIQTIGRAARNEHGKVLMFADVVTGSMKRAIDETNRRRHLQQQFNLEHGITPRTIKKNVVNSLQITKQNPVGKIDKKDIPEQIEKLKALMKIASNSLDFENAIKLRDEIKRG